MQGASAIISLIGGVQPCNVFFQVADAVTIGVGARFMGILLAKTSVDLGAGASVDGRILSQAAVTLDQNNIEQPDCSAQPTVTLSKS
jgi:hypothetical protein